MPDKKPSKWTRRRIGNKTPIGPSKVTTTVSRKKRQRDSGKKVSVTHQNIYAVTLRRRHFVKLGMCMADFASLIILKNERRHVKILRIHVEWHWESEVLKYFGDDTEWMHSYFLNQVKYSYLMTGGFRPRDHILANVGTKSLLF